ncbi:MAG: family 2A encapsulin nanocompartment cargo protein cysteine desulfurase [Agriterribacter sp.]
MGSEQFENPNLPDTAALEKLANAYFSAPPGNSINNFQPEQLKEASAEQYNPSAHTNQLAGFTEKKGNWADFDANRIPASVAGSGASPSVDHGEGFNIDDPQTSLPDPHFYDGKIPASVAGSGISPSAQSFGYGDGSSVQRQVGSSDQPTQFSKHFLPFEQEQPFEKELKDALQSIQSYFPQSQFSSVSPLSGGDASYYFLNHNNFANHPSAYLNEKHFTKEHKQGSFAKPPFDINLIKADFPIFKEKVNGGKRLIWLDNAATTQKPRQVIDRVQYFYEHENSNIHRAAHELAARATDAYEAARKKVQLFLGAQSPNEIVFVRGTTEGINLVADSWGAQYLKEGDEIILSHLEHHANIVPWQLLAGKKGLKLRVIPVDDSGQIILEEYAKLLNPKTKLVSFTQVSNALGTITPSKIIIEMAHAAGAKVLLDGAQSVSHIRTNVQSLNPDWFVFSGHKVFGPTGIGVVYGKEELLNATQPYQGGGNMIEDVTFEETKFHNAPSRFEAGTGNIADAVGLGAAIDYVNKIGIDLIFQYEHALLHYATNLLKDVPGIRLIGTAAEKTSVASFVLKGYKTEEVGAALSKEGIAVRSGHHCAQPILRRFGVETTVRPSLAFYNTCADIDALVDVLYKLKKR